MGKDWSNPPLRVGVISTLRGLRLLAKKSLPVDLCEVRLDILRSRGLTLDKLVPFLKKKKQPMLMTARSSAEGGLYPWKHHEREITLMLLMPFIDWIDLELDELAPLAQVYARAKKQKKHIVLSKHFFKRFPSEKELKKTVKTFQRYRGCCKIAARLDKPADLHILSAILHDHPRNEWALMGMGLEAPRSRIVLSLLGSKLIYGYLDAPTAPGQPSIAQVNRQLEILF